MRLSFLGTLAAGVGMIVVFAAPTPVDAKDRVAYRRAHRVYDGAPPAIPHAVRSLSRQNCLTCHREGMEVLDPKGGRSVAPRSPHPHLASCQQCHVELVAKDLVSNGFDGLRDPDRGLRRFAGAPPTMPHRSFMRESCLSCHGATGGSPIRTPHPDRVNCRQCHVEPTGSDVFVKNDFRSDIR